MGSEDLVGQFGAGFEGQRFREDECVVTVKEKSGYLRRCQYGGTVSDEKPPLPLAYWRLAVVGDSFELWGYDVGSLNKIIVISISS